MLSELRVENLGVIAELSLTLGPGLTALTGETGAGKTLLVGAIELLIGGRSDASMVRPGADEARVEGRFVVGDDEQVLARAIPADGRSRAYVDGRLATVSTLAETGQRVVDLHGQNTHQSLLAGQTQREALDRFGRIELGPYQAARARVSELESSLAALGGDERARLRELELLRYQIDELDRAAIADANEDERLDIEESQLADAQAHQAAGVGGADGLLGEGGALDALRGAMHQLTGRRPYADLLVRLRTSAAELDDIGADLRGLAESIDDNPERLAEVRLRRQLLRDLRRKYGDTLADVLAERDVLAGRMIVLDGHAAEVARLDGALAEAARQRDRLAADVAAARRRAAPKLASEVQKLVRGLALANARVEVSVDGADPANDVAFLFSANKGEPLAPLTKVASGGELARTMLALRLVLSEAPDTLVFDEVDAGIGGEAALAVGRALADLGSRHQVLVVTHLAQVAAFADRHVVVSKASRGARTVAAANEVTGDDRARELARMLSGLADSDSALVHARELLDSAHSSKIR